MSQAFSGATPSWIPHATVNKSTHQVDGLVEKEERERKVRTISDSQRNFAAQFSSSAAEKGAEKSVSGSRWTPTPESSPDSNQRPGGAGEEDGSLLTRGAGQSSVGRGRKKHDQAEGEPHDDRGEASGDGSPSVQRAPVGENGEREGDTTKDKPKGLGQAAVSRTRKSCRDSITSGSERAQGRNNGIATHTGNLT